MKTDKRVLKKRYRISALISGRSLRRLLIVFCSLNLVPSSILNLPAFEPSSSLAEQQVSDADQTLIIPIHGVIDLGLAYFIRRSLTKAENEGYKTIILDVDTLGGRVDAALDIRDAIEGSKLPVIAYINKRAISAGALICLATRNISMAPGSTIGAATPVSIGPMGESGKVSEKEVSYVRGEFRATAERNGHSPVLAEAMVDADSAVFAIFEGGEVKILSAAQVEDLPKHEREMVETISPKGKLLTLTSAEAKRLGLAASNPESLDALIVSLGLNPERRAVSSSTWSEVLVRFLTNPIVSGLLLTLGVLGIFFELQAPGWGISGTLGTIFLLLFFGGHYLAGLANILDVLLFIIGFGLIALEIFVIPGFGVTGISGVFFLLVAVYLALVKRPIPQFSWDYQQSHSALLVFSFVILGVTLGTIIIWKTLPHTRFKKLFVLTQREEPALGYVAGENLERLVGSSGTSITPLRPAGKASIGHRPIEVQTQGEFIERNRQVRVVRVMGNKIFVAEQQEDRNQT